MTGGVTKALWRLALENSHASLRFLVMDKESAVTWTPEEHAVLLRALNLVEFRLGQEVPRDGSD